MKTEEAIVDGKKINVVIDFDDSLIEEVYIEKKNDDKSLDDTIDLSKTIEVMVEKYNE